MTTPPATEASAPQPDDGPVLSPAEGREVVTLLASIFTIAACGLIYELLIATVSSYLLGSSVTQFSLCIGIFIGSMGLGSHLSQQVQQHLLRLFILIEVALGVLGGLSVCLLFWVYATGPLYWVVLYALLIAIGALTGLELPLLTRLLRPYGSLRRIIAQALSFDYIGALAGAVLFPLLLLPSFGMTRTALVVGSLNVAVALWNVQVFRSQLAAPRFLRTLGGFSAVCLAAGLLFSFQVVSFLESRLYQDTIVHSAQTPYQRVILTRWRDDLRLFLDGKLQFSSIDEYRYHEALIHPAMSLAPVQAQVLLLGAGDGLAARELLKYPGVQRLTLVDLDPHMTHLGKTYPALVALNARALHDARVHIVTMDAHTFLAQDTQLYDVIVSDLPDPNNEVLAKLYAVEHYRLVRRRLAASGVFVTQATSPFFARTTFWCIVQTLEAAGLHTVPMHAYVPSFGDWGFVLAAAYALPLDRLALQVPTRFLTPELLPTLWRFGKDTSAIETEASTFDHPVVLHYYLQGWHQWE